MSFSILLNGAPFGLFKASRGLRQGDPLFLFLYVLITEILTRIIRREEERGLIHGIKIARAAHSIFNLLFADDVMLFCRANEGKRENCTTAFRPLRAGQVRSLT